MRSGAVSTTGDTVHHKGRRSGSVEVELSAAQRTRKAETMRALRARAGELVVEAGQVWEHIGSLSLVDPGRRLPSDHSRIRIVQVAGVGRARTTRFVKVNPPRGGNGGFDRQSHRIEHVDLARSYRLVEPSGDGRWG